MANLQLPLPGAAQLAPQAPPKPQARLPRIREDLKLFPGPRHRDGSPSWRMMDPVRNRFFEIGWLEFELLARWADHRTAESLSAQVAEETALDPTEDEVAGFVEFLGNNQLVVAEHGESYNRLRKRWLSAEKPWYEKLFHGYLYFRIPLARPDRFLEKTLPFVEVFYTRAFALLVLTVFVVDLYLLSREWDELRRSFAYFFNLEGGLYYLLAGSAAKVVHELAHAYTAKRYGVRVPVMGAAFMVLAPFLYTDTSETWKLSDRNKQIAIASAGMASELALAVFATFLWSISPEGAAKHVLFVLATTTWVLTLAINASPFMRFDGYFVVSDALDFPNLHERSFACTRWWIRSYFFGLREALPEPTFSVRQRAGLVLFGLAVWLYRLVLFLGIAVLVYYMFFKLLGIAMLVLELYWFVFRPISTEVGYIWSRRKRVHIGWVPFSVVFLLLLSLVWLVPVSREMTAPAVLRAGQEQAIYAPVPGKIIVLNVKPGQEVRQGEVLARLESPELLLRAKQADSALMSAQWEYRAAAASSRQQEARMVLLERIAEALAEQTAVKEETARLTIVAGFDGVVRDMSHHITPGRWVGSRELLLRLVQPAAPTIEAYVSESRIESVKVGQIVKFIPTLAGAETIHGRVKAIDATGSRNIGRLLLVSPMGGDIPAILDRKGGAVAHDPLYRVLIEPEAGPRTANSVERGTVRIDTDLVLLTQNFLYRAVSIFVRESSF